MPTSDEHPPHPHARAIFASPQNSVSSSMSPSTTLLDELDEPMVTTAQSVTPGHSAEPSGVSSRPDVSDSGADDSSAGGTETGIPPSATEDDELWRTSGFKIGFSEDKNKKYRRTMEDAHSYFYNFGQSNGSGWFAVFDGHAGKSAADWCGEHMHTNFEQVLRENPTMAVPELLNKSFLLTDRQLSERKGSYSGCTAVVGYIRTEERPVDDSQSPGGSKTTRRRRVLYTANAGDARAVLCRNGTAVRLSYDHKGSDPAEARRIMESGGFVMNNRVNGVLAVTRSLGDISMKEWVIGSPYTTETVLDENDSFLILACDGIWDVCSDQTATDLIHGTMDPQQASDDLLDYALDNFSTDNLSVMIVRIDQQYVP
ncbi:Protein phosphatase 2C 1 [Thoreauomyces humboldtii]|nr:Protein phosphatase 2C 1 [Thoreauomyces humboldtii]